MAERDSPHWPSQAKHIGSPVPYQAKNPSGPAIIQAPAIEKIHPTGLGKLWLPVPHGNDKVAVYK